MDKAKHITRYRHQQAPDILMNPHESITTVGDNEAVNRVKAARLLGISPADLEQLISAGALRLHKTTDGRNALKGGELLDFSQELRPVELVESTNPHGDMTDEDDQGDEDDEGDPLVILAPLSRVRHLLGLDRGNVEEPDEPEERPARRSREADEDTEPNPRKRRFPFLGR